MLDPVHQENLLNLRFHDLLQKGLLSLLHLRRLMQVIEVIRISVLELLLHEHFLDVPRLDMLDLQNRPNSILINKFAELMSIQFLMTLFIGQVDIFPLVHRDRPVVMIQSQPFPYFIPNPLYFPIIRIILSHVQRRLHDERSGGY